MDHFGWGAFIFGLCQGDITKLESVEQTPIETSMAFLRYQKNLEQGQKRIAKIKNNS